MQEPRKNKYKRKKKEKIVEDLRDLLSSSSSVINEDYSLNIHTHDIYGDPEFHTRLEDLGESVTFWKSLKLRNDSDTEDVDKKDNCDNIEYSSNRESRKDAEFECTVYPGIVNVDSKPKDNSEEQYTFIQNCMHTQELDNDKMMRSLRAIIVLVVMVDTKMMMKSMRWIVVIVMIKMCSEIIAHTTLNYSKF